MIENLKEKGHAANDASLQLILDFEVAGGEQYYNWHLQSPIWPGASPESPSASVTISDTTLLLESPRIGITPDPAVLNRLLATAGKKGPVAKAALAAVKDIKVPWPAAVDVFERVTVPRYTDLTRDAFPGIDNLDPNCQGALVSLIFNRGAAMNGPRRSEMRAIRDLVPQKDYAGIAQQIRNMKRLWKGTDIERGMNRRREAEADLVLKSQ